MSFFIVPLKSLDFSPGMSALGPPRPIMAAGRILAGSWAGPGVFEGIFEDVSFMQVPPA
jgi:hypothetical protein